MTYRISAKIKPNSKHQEGVAVKDGVYIVATKAPAIDGKANERAIELLAKHLGARKTQIKLVSGYTSRFKIFEIT